MVGGDLRPSTAPLKEALIEGLMSAGCRVIDLGVAPTPAFYFARDFVAADGGVMVTGSHNPPGDNGFKLSLGPWPITEDELTGLERRVVERDFALGTGTIERRDVAEAYGDFIGAEFDAVDDQKVVVDAGNGCYARIAPRVLREVGCEVVELFCQPDGRFPCRPPNPAVSSHLQALCETVVRSEADLGAAYDGDGDRVVFVDERGRIVQSDCTIVLFARHLLARRAGEVVYDVKCSSAVPEAIRQAGGIPVMERSGHAFIKTTLLRRDAVLGGEISGHFFFEELGRDDGLYATLLMLRILSERGRGLAGLADTVPRYPITPDIRLPCQPSDTEAIVQKLTQAFAGQADCDVSTLDGVRIDWSDGWALIRPSVTEPMVTLRFEAHNERRLASIQDEVLARSWRLRRLIQ